MRQIGGDVALRGSTVVAVLAALAAFFTGIGAFSPDVPPREALRWRVVTIALVCVPAGVVVSRVRSRLTLRPEPDVIATIGFSDTVYQVGDMNAAFTWRQTGDVITFIVFVQNNRDRHGEFHLLLVSETESWLETPSQPLRLSVPGSAVIRAEWSSRLRPITQDFNVSYRLRARSKGGGRLVRTVRRNVLRERNSGLFKVLAAFAGHIQSQPRPLARVHVYLKANELPGEAIEVMTGWTSKLSWSPGDGGVAQAITESP